MDLDTADPVENNENLASIDEQRADAVSRMRLLKFADEQINAFETDGLVYIRDSASSPTDSGIVDCILSLCKRELKAPYVVTRYIQQSTGNGVSFRVMSDYAPGIGDICTMPGVSQFSSDWEIERKALFTPYGSAKPDVMCPCVAWIIPTRPSWQAKAPERLVPRFSTCRGNPRTTRFMRFGQPSLDVVPMPRAPDASASATCAERAVFLIRAPHVCPRILENL